MIDIGVRELKQRLSEILDRAAAGEVVRITDRGRPKAVIGPIEGQDVLALGIEQGWITPPSAASEPGRVAMRDVVHRADPDSLPAGRLSIAQALSEDRGD